MTVVYRTTRPTFVPSVPLSTKLHSLSTSASPRHPACLRRRLSTARISNGLPAYRAALLTRRDDPIQDKAGTLTKPAKLERRGKRSDESDTRYRVRMAEDNELYTVADIRCDAFYGYPKDPYYYPVRRREIYMAMRDRIDSGNKCLVVLDTSPPQEYETFANRGELVVGSLDVSLHKASSGRRCRFDGGGALEDGRRRIYLSSMAVREEWQGRGLAQRLLKQVDQVARANGIEEVFLHVELENAPAVHLYGKCGYVSVEEDSRVPRWLHFLAKREHTLMRKVAM